MPKSKEFIESSDSEEQIMIVMKKQSKAPASKKSKAKNKMM